MLTFDVQQAKGIEPVTGGEVWHLVAIGFRDLPPLLGRLVESSKSRDFH